MAKYASEAVQKYTSITRSMYVSSKLEANQSMGPDVQQRSIVLDWKAYRPSQARVCAVVAAVDDGGVEASEELEVATAGPRLHHVESFLDAKLDSGTAATSTQVRAQVRGVTYPNRIP